VISCCCFQARDHRGLAFAAIPALNPDWQSHKPTHRNSNKKNGTKNATVDDEWPRRDIALQTASDRRSP
jgi:hypothetical protein